MPDSDSLPFSLKIGPMDIYNAIRRKVDIDTQLAPRLEESIEEWVNKLKSKGWAADYQKMPGEEARDGWTISLCSAWQGEVHASSIILH